MASPAQLSSATDALVGGGGPPEAVPASDAEADGGLTSAEAAERVERFGLNEVAEAPARTWLALAREFWGVIPWMLEATIAIDLVLGRWAEAGVIAALLAFSAALGFFQEQRGKQAVALLRQQLTVSTRVRRDGHWQIVPAATLVPDDLVHLRVGDIVPADVRLSDGLLSLDQAQLTGESLPVEAGAGAEAYAGSRVARGEATGTVTATAARTRFGRTAQLVELARAPRRLEQFIVKTATYLFALDALLIAVVAAAAAVRGDPLFGTLRFTLMLLVAAVPVALPAMFSMSAAVGARMLAGNGVLTTRLSAIEDAATMDVLCLDKTGTITENRLGVEQLAPVAGATAEQVLRLAALASDEATQDPIDLAILSEARLRGLLDGQPPERVRFQPFDPATKRSEAEVREDGRLTRVAKGEPSTLAALADTPWPELEAEVARLSADGSRVLAVASGEDGALPLVGLVALADRLRPDSAALVEQLTRQQVRVVLVTGDGAAPARAVAAKAGIRGEVAPTGTLENPDPEAIERYAVFSGVLPEHKFRLVEALQEAGHVVGMTGDGVNDAPALGQADVGIAVSGATDVARASASLVLTGAGLGGILTAIQGSRTIYRRMQSMLLGMVSRKAAMPPFLALVLLAWDAFALSPLLIVLFMLLGEATTFGFAKDRVVPSATPDRWVVRSLVVIGTGFATLLFAASLAVFSVARYGFGLTVSQTQTVVFLWLLLAGGQAVLYLVRTRSAFWVKPYPAAALLWVTLADSAVGIVLATQGWLMSAISLAWIAGLVGASLAFLVLGNGFSLAAWALIRRRA